MDTEKVLRDFKQALRSDHGIALRIARIAGRLPARKADRAIRSAQTDAIRSLTEAIAANTATIKILAGQLREGTSGG